MPDRAEWNPIVFPAHALLIIEERLKDQKTEGVRMPEAIPLGEIPLRVLIAAALTANWPIKRFRSLSRWRTTGLGCLGARVPDPAETREDRRPPQWLDAITFGHA